MIKNGEGLCSFYIFLHNYFVFYYMIQYQKNTHNYKKALVDLQTEVQLDLNMKSHQYTLLFMVELVQEKLILLGSI